ncbi:MAG: hypothetical protein V2B15_12265 [Bacteroidota bacterium]
MAKERIIYTLLLAALLAVPVYLLRDKMDTEEIRKNRYWVAKSSNTRQYPVLFGGDSRVFRGISPDQFEQGMYGYEAFNYAYWSNGMGRIYLEGLEQKMDKHSDLKMIVLGVSPHSLTPRGADCGHYKTEMGRTKEQVLQQRYLSRLQEVFATYEALELIEKVMGRDKPSNYRIIYHPDGWVESWWLQPDTSYSARFYEEIFTGNRVSEEVIAGLLGYVEKWTAMGIHVAGFRPPTSHTIMQMEEERGGFDEAVFVERFTRAGGIWIHFPPDRYQTFDGNHLEHQSAARLSADLADSIRARIPVPASKAE